MDKLTKSFKNIIVVNDGSRDTYEQYFKDFEKKGIIVLKHHINYGKGRALKTALNYILNEYKDIKAIITADSDGQHSPEDIEKVANVTKNCFVVHPKGEFGDLTGLLGVSACGPSCFPLLLPQKV